MSQDIYFQRFENGGAGIGGGADALRILAPFLRPSQGEPEKILHPGGTAEVYGLNEESDGMMVTHVDGDGLWDLLVETARLAEWVVMPVGCPACIPSPSMRRHLPTEIAEDVVVIEKGSDLRRVIVQV